MPKRKGGNVTIRDVAAQASVSAITASRALRGSDLVRPETRRQVERVAQELGYIPNFAAGMLNSNVSRMVAVVVPNFANSIFATTLQEIGEGLREAGYQLLVGCNDYSVDREQELVQTFLSRGADAVVLTGHLYSEATKKLLRQSGVPVIEMWSLGDRPLGISIGVDDHQAALDAVRHLVSRGRRCIGYIGGAVDGNDRAQARLKGFRAALAEAGLPQDARLERTGTFEFDTGATAIADMLKVEPGLDAVFAASDIIATGVLLRCMQDGIEVPGRLAICGFDDARIVQMLRPALTTIKFSRREIGQQVAATLLDQMGKLRREPRVMRIAHELIVRETT
ncbi:MAG: LacI family DNA-binding transcriptional regulator [Roseovarius sp.]